MSASTVVLLAPATPLVGALAIYLTRHRPNVREAVTLATAALLFGLVASLYPAVASGGRPAALLAAPLPGLALAFEVEPLGMLFALVASFLWIVTSIYSIGYMRGNDEPNQTRFFIYFALALSATIGVAFAANLFTLFVFYEALTLSTYPLVAHHGTAEAKAGGRTYLGLLLGTSIAFFLFAVIVTWNVAGTLEFSPGGILAGKAPPWLLGVLLALYVFGIGKAAVMPFHRWLPAAMVAPVPVSALLHAVAVVKAGVFSVLKVAVYVFGLDLLADLAASRWLMYVAAATILLASLVALTRDNLKARLAYSTISQLSFIVLGAMLANPAGLVGGAMHLAMHAFGKITLFFCAGAIYVATGKTEVSQMRGLGRAMPVTMAAFLIGALSTVGLPPFGGLWSKWYLALGTLDAGEHALLAVLLVSALLNIAYMVPIPLRAFFCPPDNPSGNPGEGDSIREAPMACVVALSLTALGCLALFIHPDPLYRLIASLAP